MDHNNEEEVYSKLRDLDKRQDILLELEEQQISVVNTTLQEIQKPLATLINKQQRIAYQINDLQNITEQVARTQLRQEIVSNIILQVLEIESRQQTLLDIILATQNNQIHPLLISPKTLSSAYRKSNPLCKHCLPILRQTAHVRSHLLNDKLIIKVNLPIFNLPKMQYSKIWTFPIHTPNHTVIVDIKYSHLILNPHESTFALLTPPLTRNFQKITSSLRKNTFVGRLNIPISHLSISQECIAKILNDPETDSHECPLKLQLPPRDTLIRMNRPNTWLYSFQNKQLLHIMSPKQNSFKEIEPLGILTITQPSQLQVANYTIHYQGANTQPLEIKQPPYFPLKHPILTTLNITPLKHSISNNQETLTVLSDQQTDEAINKGTHSLTEIQEKLKRLKETDKVTLPRTLSITSLTLAGITSALCVVYISIKIISECKRKTSNRIQESRNVVELQIPQSQAPLPVNGPRRLPPCSTFQLVN